VGLAKDDGAREGSQACAP